MNRPVIEQSNIVRMAAIESRHWQAVDSSEIERQRLISMLVEASDTCLRFCETFDNLNDMHIMLLHLNFLLHSMFDGDQSKNPYPNCGHEIYIPRL